MLLNNYCIMTLREIIFKSANISHGTPEAPCLCNMPQQLFQLVRQLLNKHGYNNLHRRNSWYSDFTDVLNLRATCRRLSAKVMESILDFHLEARGWTLTPEKVKGSISSTI